MVFPCKTLFGPDIDSGYRLRISIFKQILKMWKEASICSQSILLYLRSSTPTFPPFCRRSPKKTSPYTVAIRIRIQVRIQVANTFYSMAFKKVGGNFLFNIKLGRLLNRKNLTYWIRNRTSNTDLDPGGDLNADPSGSEELSSEG